MMWRQFQTFGEMIKFSHTIFAMPFALVSMLIAANGLPSFGTIFWILVAVITARTSAMTFNRIVDREIDADNPRTKNRALVTGEVSMKAAGWILTLNILVFMIAAGMLNSLAFYLSIPCLAVLLGYSLMKRLTSLVHLFLGFALGLAPIGAWVAVLGELNWIPIILSVAITFWVAGFDILYACQDYDSDKKDERVFSIPKKYGMAKSMLIARLLHLESFLIFFLFWLLVPSLGFFFFVGLMASAGLMIYQHSIISPKDISRIDAAFFGANGKISVILFLMSCLDILVF